VSVGVTVHDLTARRWLRGAGWQHLRPKYLKIFHKNNINCYNLGAMVGFEFKNPYKLCVLIQHRTLCALRIASEICCLLPMNQSYWEDLVISPTFAKFSELNQKFILEKILGPSPVETVSTSGDVASKGASMEVVSMEALAPVPMVLRSPRPKPTPNRETQIAKLKKDKLKKLVLVCKSPKKNTAMQKQKKEKQLEKVVDLEVEEGQGVEDIDAEGMEPIIKLPKYIPLQKGKMKITKDLDLEKFTISTALLPKQVPFEGLRLTRSPLLKMEDWDLMDHARFPHLATNKYMRCVYYVESSVTALIIEEWAHGV